MGVLNPDEITTAQVEKMFQAAYAHAAGRDTRNAYFDGDVELDKLGIKIPAELDIFRTVFNFGRIYVSAQLDRMILETFRLLGADKATIRKMEAILKRSNFKESAWLAIQEALVQKRAYGIVGGDGNGNAVITFHTAVGIHVEYDPITRKPLWAFQAWGAGTRNSPRRGTLYLRGTNVDYTKTGGIWKEDERRTTGLTEVAVVGLINRAALGDFRGRSELDDTNKFTDAGARTLTNLQIAGESVALPHRAFFGVDDESKPKTPAEQVAAYLSRTSYFKEAEGKAIQLPGADLRGFIDTLTMFARDVAASTGLPLDYLGIHSDNPSSAQAIARGEARLLKRVMRKMALFGEALETLMRLALEIEGVKDVEIEAVWQAPDTPDLAGVTDAVVKLRSPGPDGKPLITADTGRKMLGMSPEARQREAQAIEDEFNGLAGSSGWAA